MPDSRDANNSPRSLVNQSGEERGGGRGWLWSPSKQTGAAPEDSGGKLKREKGRENESKDVGDAEDPNAGGEGGKRGRRKSIKKWVDDNVHRIYSNEQDDHEDRHQGHSLSVQESTC